MIRVFRKSVIAPAIGALAYSLLIQYAYVFILQPAFAYLGYAYNPAPLEFLVLATLLSVAPAFWMTVEVDRPSKLAYWIFYALVYVPSSVIPYLVLPIPPTEILAFSGTLFLCFATLWGFCIAKPVSFSFANKGMKGQFFWVLFFSFQFISMILIVRTFGFHFRIPSLLEVYDVRSEYKEIGKDAPGYVRYLVTWQGNVFGSFLLCYSIAFRKWTFAILGMIPVLFVFMITGFKSVIFTPALIFLLAIGFGRTGVKFGKYVLGGVVFAVAASVVASLYFDYTVFTNLFIRRVIIVPGLLSAVYYDFFSNNQHLFLSESIFKSFVDYPYPLPVVNLISKVYFSHEAGAANVNVWGDAFANFGLVGMFVFTLVLGFALQIFDSISRDLDTRFAALLLGIYAVTMSNSALLTSMLTGGLISTMVVLLLFPRSGAEWSKL